jgi:hypothetical protein
MKRIALLAIPLMALVATSAAADQVVASDDTGGQIATSFPLTMFQSVSASTIVPVTTTLHHSHAHIDAVRYGCESSVKQTVAASFTGTGAASESFTINLTVNPASCPKGWQELRITSNGTEPDGDRIFTTTRECVNDTVGNGTSQNYCGGPTVPGRCGGGGWYVDTTYLVGNVDCRDWSKAAGPGFGVGDAVRVRTQSIGGGLVTFDGGSSQATPPSNAWSTVRIPVLAPGLHTMALTDSRLGFGGSTIMPLRIV